MPMISRKIFEWLLQAATSNAPGTQLCKIFDGKTTVKAWGTFGGCTIHVQVLAEDGTTWIDAYTFTAAGVQFGEVGSNEEVFRAEVTGATGTTNVNCTITQ